MLGSEGVKLAQPADFWKIIEEVTYLRSIFVGFSWTQTFIFTAQTSTNEVLGVRVCLERFGRGFESVNLADPLTQFLGPLQQSTNDLDNSTNKHKRSSYDLRKFWVQMKGSKDVKLAEPALFF